MKQSSTILCVLFVMLSAAVAQTGHSRPAQSASPEPEFKALMQRIWDAWSSGDPANAAPFYSKGADHVFFDVTPVKYDDWSQYNDGVKKVLANFQSAKFKVNHDARVHRLANYAWATSTVDADLIPKNGSEEKATWRWTVVWQRSGRKWLIIHEHISAPLP
jgi:ketosteroid isomerase-like protein